MGRAEVDRLIKRFEDAVRANGYRTRSDATEQELEEARAQLRKALLNPGAHS